MVCVKSKHAPYFVNASEVGWKSVECSDEHYLPTVLAFHGFDNETTCGDSFAHDNWPSLKVPHPKTYLPDEIIPQLFVTLQRPG